MKSIWKEAVLARLAEALAGPLDVIVLGRVPARKFPAETLEALETRVRQGAGLVYLWPDHEPHAAFLNVVREGLGEEPQPTPPCPPERGRRAKALGDELEPADSVAAMPPLQPSPRAAPISTISTILRPPDRVVEMGAPRRCPSSTCARHCRNHIWDCALRLS